MSKPFVVANVMAANVLAATVVMGIAGAALAAPPTAPSEPEQTINAIGADVSSRAQWFGDAIDHVLSGDPVDAKAPAPAPSKAHQPAHPQP